MKDSTVFLPDMCRAHQAELVNRLRIPESGPWQSTLVIMNIRLFQAATANPKVWERCSVVDDGKRDESDLTLVLAEIGCLACFDRHTYGETLSLMRTKGVSHVAKLTHDFKGKL